MSPSRRPEHHAVPEPAPRPAPALLRPVWPYVLLILLVVNFLVLTSAASQAQHPPPTTEAGCPMIGAVSPRQSWASPKATDLLNPTPISDLDTSSQPQSTGCPTLSASGKGGVSGQSPTALPPPPQPPAEAPIPDPTTTPDQDSDALLSAFGLASTQTYTERDSTDTTQHFNAIPLGSGSDAQSAATPDDSDSDERNGSASSGLFRGRHAGAAYSFSHAAIREFRTTATIAPASSAQGPGATFQTFTRSGTDRFHGALELALRSSALAARNAAAIASSYQDGVITTSTPRPHDLRENLALSLGGPVPHFAPMHFFYAFDAQRRGFPAISAPADPNFYRLSNIQTALLATRGVTSKATNAALNYLSSLTGQTDRRNDQTLNFLRLDWRHTTRLTLTADYNRLRYTAPAGLIEAPVVPRARASLGNAIGSIDSVRTSFSASLTHNLLLQTQLAYTRDLQFESPQPNLPQEPQIGPAGLAPEVNVGPNGLLFGTPASLSRSAFPKEQRLELTPSLTFIHGLHEFQLGGTLAINADKIQQLANAAGTFHYDSGTTKGFAGGLVDFITDSTFNVNTNPNGACPTIYSPTHLFCFRTFTQSFGQQQTSFHTQDFAAYAQDTWRIRPGLTLNLGARYEYTLLPFPQNPNPALDAIFQTRGATSIFPEDRNNLAPRVAIAWQPQGPRSGTVRLGYGIFYGRLPGATLRAALAETAQPSATSRIRVLPSAIIGCPQVPSQGFGYPCSFLALPASGLQSVASAVVLDRHFRLPTIQQGSLFYDRTIFRTASLSVGYLFNLDRQLPASTDLNIAPATRTALFQLQGGDAHPGSSSGQTFTLPLYTSRITPAFGPVTDITSSANATYHALLVTLSARPVSTLTLHANGSFSKAIDFGQNASAIPRTNSQLDPFRNGYDKGNATLNFPWTLHTAALWRPAPTLTSAAFRMLLTNWQLATLLTAHAGRPYSYDLFGGPRLPGGHASLNGSGGALYLPTVGRNTLRLPAVTQLDLRLSRTFATPHSTTLRLAAESPNILNSRFITSVNQRAFLVGTEANGITPLIFQDSATIAREGLTSQPFASPTATGGTLTRERQLQFTLNLSF